MKTDVVSLRAPYSIRTSLCLSHGAVPRGRYACADTRQRRRRPPRRACAVNRERPARHLSSPELVINRSSSRNRRRAGRRAGSGREAVALVASSIYRYRNCYVDSVRALVMLELQRRSMQPALRRNNRNK
ncbi:hypothetical protein EVAR_33235_1 [Eumeta japonica]|uniref:Uncharacterized protein n=1 Tax=Eumeta variegata TaxID=151549 RepID=A0A4C1W2P8_EUMVA|nr:hypothetical protein EVAR_33235_1 [Eumeta japonica]